MIRRKVRFPDSCRESMVKNPLGQLGEYPSECSAAPRTTLYLNSFRLNTLRLTSSAEQWFSFPIPIQATVAKMEGLQDCVRRDFNACSLDQSMELGIEQFAEADLQRPVMLFADVWFMVRLKVFGEAKSHASCRRRLSSTVPCLISQNIFETLE